VGSHPSKNEEWGTRHSPRRLTRLLTIRLEALSIQKHVISVGFDIPGKVCECVDFNSDTSLLDADIVVFSPNLEDYTVEEPHLGKDLLAKESSGRLLINSAHWNRELLIALDAGKTVFVVILGVESLYVFTGQTNYSGTGKNARRTNVVDIFDPYSAVPLPGLGDALQRRAGERIKTTKDIGLLSAYWQEFGEVTYYQGYLQEQIGVPALVTQTGDKMVGGIVRFKDRKGTVILLPVPNLEYMADQREGETAQVLKPAAEFAAEESDQDDAPSEAERGVGNQFISALIEIDKILRAKAERTPAPAWANAKEYDTKEEARLKAKVSELEAGIAELQKQKLQVDNDLDAAENLRGLLFEKGKPLESAILEALRVIGFAAEGFVDAESEFDSVFTDPFGSRLLGEAEGKDDKAVNIDKLDQLERNIQEDFAKRPDSTDYAKGVLFGNAFRLSPISERGDFFTQKCLAGAKRLGVALVRTPDLFALAKFLKENHNPEFATSCREAFLNAKGDVVIFPPVPESYA
jgi:hypothetical protein